MTMDATAKKTRRAAPVLATCGLGLLVGLLGGMLLAPAGCTAQQCQGAGGDPDRPSSAVECGAGFLCYRGSCVGGCNAGAEHVQACTANGDCDDPVRSSCVAGFCSACAENEVCVPRLNICERVRSQSFDGGPRDAGPPKAQDPLDGGRIDGSVFRLTDTGDDDPIDVPFSHYGTITISRVEDMLTSTVKSDITAEILDVRNSSVAPENVEINDSDRNPYVECEIAELQRIAPRTEISIADISIQGDLRGGVGLGYNLHFDGMHYVVEPTPPPDLLVYTIVGDEKTVRAIGGGNRGLGFFPFPPAEDPSHLIPYELTINPEMVNKLRTGFVVANPPGDAILFSWSQPFACPAGAPDQCHGRGHSIVVRVVSPTHEMRCSGPEISPIRLTEPFLARFHNVANLGPNTVLPLFFERRYLSRMSMPTQLESGVRIDMKMIITHAFQSRIIFQ
ncbi:MAG: hypothetical protein HY791_32925 [Deltaproteobacteria bacterium]|nr:hypothetical protein [Deltaproteobacteria bacterium]